MFAIPRELSEPDFILKFYVLFRRVGIQAMNKIVFSMIREGRSKKLRKVPHEL